MNKNLTALILTGALACAMTLPAMAAGNPAVPVISDDPTAEEQLPLPDSVLYYGTIQEIGKDEDGDVYKRQAWASVAAPAGCSGTARPISPASLNP